jgi:predicted RNA-binding Zn ribbon-like protein
MFLDDYSHGARIAADLVNTVGSVSGTDHLPDRASLRSFLEQRGFPGAGAVTERDLRAVKELRTKLTAVFRATNDKARVKALNALLNATGSTPTLAMENGEVRLDFAPPSRSSADKLAVLTATGLAWTATELGLDRMGLCEADQCADAYVDNSKNGSRRFCGDSCASRTHVAAYRARRTTA